MQVGEVAAQVDPVGSPVVEEAAAHLGLGLAQVDGQRDIPGQPRRIAAQLDVGERRFPDPLELPVVDRDPSAHDPKRGQEGERPVDRGLRHEIFDHRG